MTGERRMPRTTGARASIPPAPDGPDEMGRELAEGPDAVAATLALLDRDPAGIDARAADAARRIVLVGTGASLAMAHVAAPEWRRSERARGVGRARPVLVRESTESIFGGLDGEAFDPADLVVAISQSGASPETLEAAARAGECGARLVAVTARAPSPLADVATATVLVGSGEELGAATKSELATLAALLAMAGALPPDGRTRDELRGWLSEIVAATDDLVPVAETLATAGRMWVVGLGPATGLAHACALVWHEKVHRAAVASTASEFRHGLVESVGPDAVVLVLPPPRRSADTEAYLALLAREAAEVGAAVLVLDASATPRAFPAVTVPAPAMPGALPSSAALLGTLLRIQQLARGTAHAAGTYVDGFRVLRHVVRPAPPPFG